MPTSPVVVVPGVSHVDHGITPAQLAWILAEIGPRDTDFLLEKLELPPELGTVLSGLYGPIAGDPPIGEEDVVYRRRGDRKIASRLIRRPLRPTNRVVVIACRRVRDRQMPEIDAERGPEPEPELILATVYGGPLAPREPWDESIQEVEPLLADSHAFWRDHALALE